MKKKVNIKKTGVLLTSTLIFSTVTTSYAKDDFSYLKENQIVNSMLEDSLSEKQPTAVKVPWFKLVWKVLNHAGNSFINKNGTSSTGPYNEWTSSGKVGFNKGEYGARIYHYVNIDSRSNYIETVCDTSIFDWFNTISVLIDNPSGTPIASKSVTKDQRFGYKIKNTDPIGDWKVSFVENDKKEWDCRVIKWFNWSSTSSSSSTQAITQELDLYSIKTGETQKANAVITDKHIFIKPSFKTQKAKFENKKMLNLEELLNETYDTNLQMYVSDFKSYDLGDEILFKDTIDDIQFDESKNITIFTFKNSLSETTIDWPFTGNLTSNYKKGSSIKLKFKVVEKDSSSEHTFKTINYAKEGLDLLENNTYPDITNYIQK